jgi:hypothetical protein
MKRTRFLIAAALVGAAAALAEQPFGVSERSRLKAANAATIKKYLKPGVIRDLD